ncbi:hypothetical protein C0J50_14416 [Silurus asotus]|uniref:Uncharacterized protein n=1 Tax=Silurus asotus TaxID=30991 RepID=A0AAD5AZS6_SILAS|nr:hypothetical protein C0J50_14416 [Silurus asotus]
MSDPIKTSLRQLLISYPAGLRNKQDKKEYKDKLLRNNPESLRADATRDGTKITDLLFYTEHTESWLRALTTHYTHHTTRDIQYGRQMTIRADDGDGNLTVNIYKSGMIMFQGSEARLRSVPDDFNTLKTLRGTYTGTERKPGTVQERQPEIGSLRTELNEAREDLHPGDQTMSNLTEQLQSLQVVKEGLQSPQPANLQPEIPSIQPEPQHQQPEPPSCSQIHQDLSEDQ